MSRRRSSVPPWLIAALAIVVGSGCFLDRSALGGGSDGGPPGVDADFMGPDAAGSDAGSEEDAGNPDADAGMDAGPPPVDDAGPVDAGFDAGPADAGPADAGPPDTGPPDTGPPDTGPPDTGPPDAGPPSCEDLYDSPSRFVCVERATECEMYVDLGGSTSNCTAFCNSFGGTAIRCYREAEPGNPNCGYMFGTTRSCSVTHDDEICVCSR